MRSSRSRIRRIPAVVVTPTTPPDQLPQLLTVKQAADWTQQSPWTIRKAVKDGLLRPKRNIGRKIILIPRDQFLTEAQTQAEVGAL